MIFFDKQY